MAMDLEVIGLLFQNIEEFPTNKAAKLGDRNETWIYSLYNR